MVTRRWWLPALLLLGGCPDGVGGGSTQTIVTGLLAPSDLTVDYDGGSRVILSWTDHATNETGFRLEMSRNPFGGPAIDDFRLLPAAETSAVYPTLPHSTYYFRVFAVTATQESEPSNVAVATTPNVPDQPTGVHCEPANQASIAVFWDDVSLETSYVIERSSDGGVTWVEVETVAADETTVVTSGMTPETTYAHRVIAVNGFGRSTPSDPGFAETTAAMAVSESHKLNGNIGRFASLAMRPGGAQEFISCYDEFNRNVAYVESLAIGGTTLLHGAPIGLEDVGGDGTSIAFDAAGKAHVVAHDTSIDALRYITNETGSWVGTTVDFIPGSSVGAKPKIVCDRATGKLHVVHQALLMNGRRIARYASKVPGNSWSLGEFTPIQLAPNTLHSLALDSAGVPHLLVVVSTGRLYHVRGPGSPGQEILPLGSAPDFTSMTIDASGIVHAAYRDSVAKELIAVHQSGSGWTYDVVHSEPGQDLGSYCSIGHDPASGRLHLAYYDATRQDLRYARKDPGGGWVLKLIDALDDVGSHCSLAVDSAGAVHIAYRHESRRRLRTAVGTP